METEFIKTLINQAPGLAVAAFIVWQFLRSMDKRDQTFIDQTSNRDKLFLGQINIFIDQLNKVVERLQSLEQLIISHDARSKDAWDKRTDTLDLINKKLDATQQRALRQKSKQ